MGEERRIERLEFELAEAGADILDLRKQLAEALADCAATSYKLSEAFDELVAYELQLAEANRKLAERINDDQRYLVAPLCNAEKALDDCQAELAEARAEIEQLKSRNNASVSAHMWLIMRHAFTSGAYKGYAHGTEHKLLEQMFKEWCSKDYPEAAEKEVERLTEIERKDRLIEQMRDALSWQCAGCPDANDYGDKRHCDECSIKQLLSAAERMGK